MKPVNSPQTHSLDHGQAGPELAQLHPVARGHNGHSHCLMCGQRNPDSLGLNFRACSDGRVWAEFQGNPRLQGYDGILHGGIVGALLDAAMTHCLFSRGIQAVTGDLRIRFKQPVPCEAPLKVWASMVSANPPVYHMESGLMHGAETMAWAKASFMMRSSQAPVPGDATR